MGLEAFEEGGSAWLACEVTGDGEVTAADARIILRAAVGLETLCDHVSQEHSMRDAIGAGFLNTDDIHARLFPFSDRPSNAEFIYTLAELVRDRIASERR